jgi:1-acyl-sn-glycerol-3-phosphate acyltransferase
MENHDHLDRKRVGTPKVSTIVCNHTGLSECLNLVLSPLFPAFTPKAELKNVPFIGTFARGFQSIFVNRAGTEEERNALVKTIMKRQIEIEDGGKNYSPILIFAEGTTTNGSALLPFKRGAFQAMRTI